MFYICAKVHFSCQTKISYFDYEFFRSTIRIHEYIARLQDKAILDKRKSTDYDNNILLKISAEIN